MYQTELATLGGVAITPSAREVHTMKTIFLIPLLLLLSVVAFGQCCQSGIGAGGPQM